MIKNYDYYPQHMHIHTSYEAGASMDAQVSRAKSVGLRHIWLTDHDCLRGTRSRALDRLDFEWDDISTLNADGKPFGFKYRGEGNVGLAEIVSKDAYEGTRCMKLSCENDTSEWQGCAVEIFSYGRWHMSSLLSDLIVSLAYKVKLDDPQNSRFIIEFPLSERPPEYVRASLRLVAGNPEGLADNPHTLAVPLETTGEWQKTDFDMTALATSDAARIADIGGVDNVFDTVVLRVEARRGAHVEAYVDDFSKLRRKDGYQTYENQKEVALELEKKYGVKIFVAAEISAAGPHKNCYSTSVPYLPYEKSGYKLTDEYACKLMQSLGLTYSLNHPFVRYNGMDTSSMDLALETDKITSELFENSAHGATLLEIGFPYGRYMPLECHTRLWDNLALGGLILTGYGATDSHSAWEGWYDKNDPGFKNGVPRGEKMFKNTFVTWFGVESGKEPCEADFVDAMKRGNGYTATPMLIKGGVDFKTESGLPMGSIIISNDKDPIRVKFTMENAHRDWRLVWIENGQRVEEIPLCDGGFEADYDFIPKKDISLVRAEIYDEDGILILLTNPIYYAKDKSLLKKNYGERIAF